MTGHDDHGRGLADDLALLSRRRMFQLAGTLAATSTLAACATGTEGRSAVSSETTKAPSADPPSAAHPTPVARECVDATPRESIGPYPGDGSNGPNVLIESGIIRSDIRSSFGPYSGVAQGVPATIELSFDDVANGCAVGAGMAVYIFHCDRQGNYSLYSAPDYNYLRGIQVADKNGDVTFRSVFPACYSGRWPHIHFEVFGSLVEAVAGREPRLISQIALPEEACNAVFAHDPGYIDSERYMAQQPLRSDFIFGDGWDAELATVTGSPASGMTIALRIGVPG
ncbi:MAG: dioxygenase [Mycobacterium sp.]